MPEIVERGFFPALLVACLLALIGLSGCGGGGEPDPATRATMQPAGPSEAELYQRERPNLVRRVANFSKLNQHADIIDELERWKIHLDGDLKVAYQASLPHYEQSKQEREKDKAMFEVRQNPAPSPEPIVKNVPSKPKIGEKPRKSSWDGSYFEVQNYLEGILHDPDSLELLPCGDPVETEIGWLVRCPYRAKNAFGGKVLEESLFLILNGRVIAHEKAKT